MPAKPGWTLLARGSTGRALPGVLRRLSKAGFLSRQPGSGRCAGHVAPAPAAGAVMRSRTPREGLRPWPRRAAGPQRQGPHRGLRPRLGPPVPPAGPERRGPGRAALDVLGALLWMFHNARSGVCFPSYETIAEKAGCAR